MKRAGQLIENIALRSNLCLAWLKARRGKLMRPDVRIFADHLDHNISCLADQLRQGTMNWGPYNDFIIHDPKPRRISAAPFNSRVAQHAVMNICEPIFESFQISDSYACRKGRGQTRALARAGSFSRSGGWYLKLDIKKYFDSVNRSILFNLLQRKIKDKIVLKLFESILESPDDGSPTGIPIGNLTSQYFANHYLGLMDHWVKEELRCSRYLRYMDDFVLWDDSKSRLQEFHGQIASFLCDRLELTLKPLCLNRVNQGMSFLGFKVFPNGLRLTARTRKRFVEKMFALERIFAIYPDEEWLSRHAGPLIAFVCQGRSYNFRKKTLNSLPALSF
jgi:hypothetical protein